MSKIIIQSNPTVKRDPIPPGLTQLKIAEFFSRTLQGEGSSIGTPAAFLRMKDCTLNCVWCDSSSVWRYGDSYTINEVLSSMEESGLVEDLRNGHHLVLTGGSPVKQQEELAELIALFQLKYNFLPFIEVENECVLKVNPSFAQFVSQWNNSPKLMNSKMRRSFIYKPEIIQQAAQFNNSWFKFVISAESDWKEIEEDYLKKDNELINRSQIILMPCGASRAELDLSRGMVADIAIRENVLYSERQHIVLWDQKTGV